MMLRDLRRPNRPATMQAGNRMAVQPQRQGFSGGAGKGMAVGARTNLIRNLHQQKGMPATQRTGLVAADRRPLGNQMPQRPTAVTRPGQHFAPRPVARQPYPAASGKGQNAIVQRGASSSAGKGIAPPAKKSISMSTGSNRKAMVFGQKTVSVSTGAPPAKGREQQQQKGQKPGMPGMPTAKSASAITNTKEGQSQVGKPSKSFVSARPASVTLSAGRPASMAQKAGAAPIRSWDKKPGGKAVIKPQLKSLKPTITTVAPGTKKPQRIPFTRPNVSATPQEAKDSGKGSSEGTSKTAWPRRQHGASGAAPNVVRVKGGLVVGGARTNLKTVPTTAPLKKLFVPPQRAPGSTPGHKPSFVGSSRNQVLNAKTVPTSAPLKKLLVPGAKPPLKMKKLPLAARNVIKSNLKTVPTTAPLKKLFTPATASFQKPTAKKPPMAGPKKQFMRR